MHDFNNNAANVIADLKPISLKGHIGVTQDINGGNSLRVAFDSAIAPQGPQPDALTL